MRQSAKRVKKRGFYSIGATILIEQEISPYRMQDFLT